MYYKHYSQRKVRFPQLVLESQLNHNNPQLQHLALKFFALQFFTQARMNPSTVGKGGCMAGRFSRYTMGSSSTSSSSSSGNCALPL